MSKPDASNSVIGDQEEHIFERGDKTQFYISTSYSGTTLYMAPKVLKAEDRLREIDEIDIDTLSFPMDV